MHGEPRLPRHRYRGVALGESSHGAPATEGRGKTARVSLRDCPRSEVTLKRTARLRRTGHASPSAA